MLSGKAEKCLEGNVAIKSPIVAEDELIEVVVDVLGA